MDVLVAGGHGQIAQRLLRLLAAGGHTGRGLIRNPDHAADLEQLGAVPVLCDLEQDDPRPQVGSADAIVFAAGAGPGSGPERKKTVDLGAAVKLIDAARELGVSRYLMVSTIGAHDPAGGSDAMRPYLEAKAQADEALQASGLDWTIVRPGSLTNDPGTGRVDISEEMGRRRRVPRDDIALVLFESLTLPNTVGKVFEVFSGDVPVRDALSAL
jgi:uncharacterized protein YbjT (DUF2867 family)